MIQAVVLLPGMRGSPFSAHGPADSCGGTRVGLWLVLGELFGRHGKDVDRSPGFRACQYPPRPVSCLDRVDWTLCAVLVLCEAPGDGGRCFFNGFDRLFDVDVADVFIPCD